MSRPCANCELPVEDNDWFLLDTNCLIRFHIECNSETAHKHYTDNEHKDCNKIDKNPPESVVRRKERIKQSSKNCRRGSRPAGEITFSKEFKALAKLMGVKNE